MFSEIREGPSTFRSIEIDGRETTPFGLEWFRLTQRVDEKEIEKHMENVILFCDECGWQGTEDEARKAPDLHERHDIGTPYSYVECPNFARHDEYGDRLCCGPLVYPVDCRHIYPYIAG
jgi:hypothetical protein